MKLTKAVVMTGKIAYPVLQIFYLTFFCSAYMWIDNIIKKSSLYQNWFTRDARSYLRSAEVYIKQMSENEKQGRAEIISPYKDEIDRALEDLKKLKSLVVYGKPLTSYNYLYDKAKIFLEQIATADEIE